jgi:hypothetical protein
MTTALAIAGAILALIAIALLVRRAWRAMIEEDYFG